MTKSTLRDVARIAKVHYTTVSRALNPDTAHLVNDRTMRRVLAAADSIDYRPNTIARSLRTQRSTMIGVLVNDISSFIVGAMVHGIEDVLVPAGFLTLVLNVGDDEDELSRIDTLTSRSVDGLIVSSARATSSVFERVAASSTPIVLANRRLASGSLSSVTSDDAAGMAAAVSHLIGLGHRHLAHIGGPTETSTGQIRASGFRDALTGHGLPTPGPELMPSALVYSSEEGYRLMHALLDLPEPPTAIVAGNDSIAIGCYDALRERGLRCPEDVSIVGFNDVPLVDKLSPPLTTVSVPHRQIGQEAARMLLEQLNSPATGAKTVLLPVSLVVRESTRPPRRP